MVTYSPLAAWRARHDSRYPIRIKGAAQVKVRKRGIAVWFHNDERPIVSAFLTTDQAGVLAKVTEESKWLVTVEGLPRAGSGLLSLHEARLVEASPNPNP
jgi:hypothetical protein